MIPAMAAFMAGGGTKLPDIAGLQLMLDAQDSGTITESSGDASAWGDRSAQNNDVTQGTAIRQPNTSTINGNASIFFDGDATDANADLFRDSSATITSPPATIALVFTPTSVAAGTGEIFKLRDGFNRVFSIQRVGSNLEAVEGNAGLSNSRTVAGVLAANETRWVIARYRNSGDGTSDMLTDEGNTNAASASAAINASIDDINVGANAFAGHIHQVLYWNRFLTDTERGDVDAYLDAKWTLS